MILKRLFSVFKKKFYHLQAIDEWEDAVELIIAREELIARLEKFERLASDPNRFFEKGKQWLKKRSNKSVAGLVLTTIYQQLHLPSQLYTYISRCFIESLLISVSR